MTHRDRRVVVFGSTGSIGTQTLDVVERLNRQGFRLAVVGLSVGKNVRLVAEQVERFSPEAVCVRSEEGARFLRERFPGLRVLVGETGLADLARLDEAELLVNGLVGAVGLVPTLAGLALGRTIALANKESLVVGGELVSEALRTGGGSLLPVDSEHNALFQCLEAGERSEVRRLVLTGSGGPFLRTPPEALERVGPEEALRHPNWSMGSRISVDSATMVNKGFEVIEAHYLFSLPYDQIDVVLHPGSVVHSLVEFCDGAILAELAPSDMRVAIQYALTYPERVDTGLPRLDLVAASPLVFEPLDRGQYPAFAAVLAAARRAGTAPAAINAADEVLVERFLRREIPFTGIARGLEAILARWDDREPSEPVTLPRLLATDAWARRAAAEL
ncbi:MAG: 1-deoxy-D-xylulose-5-phosphate reductoisomerase [Candidatus Bipolaricaulota bacterium]|nr:1-deoxy-D-xylulose-5-phosphate reductoisomerase [Candidatus Bipolaricaulota bacterium]